MNKQELKQIIKEEISKAVNEEKLNELNLFNKTKKVDSIATKYLNAINQNLVTNIESFDGFSNNGGIKFNLDGNDIVLSVDRTGKNINVSGGGGGVLYGNDIDVLNLIRKIDSIWGR